jgi:hypothetical protein
MTNKDFPSPLYSELGIEYQQAYDGPYEDLSYSVNGTTVIAGLKDGRITGFGRPVLAVGKKLKFAAEELYRVSDDIWYRAYEIDDFARFLLQKGYKATPYFTQVIDLSKTEAELHADVRKSYKSLLNKTYPEIICDIPGVLETIFYARRRFEYFKEIHYRDAGQRTRSDKTWDIQYDQIMKGEAFLSFDGYAGGFFIYNNHTCYYGVGCSVEGAGSHALIWKAILHAKKLGCKYFEMGEQVFFGDEKLINISKFKRGFGGQTVMRLDLRKEE